MLNTFLNGLAELGVDKRSIKKQEDFERFTRKRKGLSRERKGR